ncbi:hypothetical protein ACMA5I_01565 [Paracoccaceae bacterium GXU_MW_L88]
MKQIFATALAALTATPLLAHDGVHMHPHGGETMLTLLAILATIGAVVYVARR